MRVRAPPVTGGEAPQLQLAPATRAKQRQLCDGAAVVSAARRKRKRQRSRLVEGGVKLRPAAVRLGTAPEPAAAELVEQHAVGQGEEG